MSDVKRYWADTLSVTKMPRGGGCRVVEASDFDALADDNARLTAELAEAKREAEDDHEALRALNADRYALRAALERIVSSYANNGYDAWDFMGIAREALRGAPQSQRPAPDIHGADPPPSRTEFYKCDEPGCDEMHRRASQPTAAPTNDAEACLAEAAKYPDGSDTRMVLLQASTRIEYLERLLDRAQRPTTDEMQRTVGHTLAAERDRLLQAGVTLTAERAEAKADLDWMDEACNRAQSDADALRAELAEANEAIAATREVLAEFNSESVVVMAKRAIEERDALRAALERYGCHEAGCRWFKSSDDLCDCGLSEALRGVNDGHSGGGGAERAEDQPKERPFDLGKAVRRSMRKAKVNVCQICGNDHNMPPCPEPPMSDAMHTAKIINDLISERNELRRELALVRATSPATEGPGT